MKNLTHYICKECEKPFYIPKRIGFQLLEKSSIEVNYCPYCGRHSLFNVTFEEELGTFKNL